MKKIFITILCLISLLSSHISVFAVWTSPQERRIQIQKLAAKRAAEQKAKKVSVAKFKDGSYMINKDIQPGTYRTRVASRGCYYMRVSWFGGTFDDIIANEFTNGPAIVTISSSDKGFISKNCGTWTQDLSQITKSLTSFSDWVFITGTDITPGTYKNSGWKWCYYARLADFSGNAASIIANDFTNEVSIVTIATSDGGFKSNNCGTWNKVD